ncbi:sulfonate ABC transporter permease [Yersinia pestis]|nr:sulfonate ABC transporter permease [Yersinia pestis]
MKNIKVYQYIKWVIMPTIVLLMWQMLAISGWIQPTILPSPVAVVVRWFDYFLPYEAYNPETSNWLMWSLSGELLHDAWASIYRVIIGFLIGALLALPLGLWVGSSKIGNDLMNPLIQFLRPIPPIAYIPLAMLWFGLGNPPAFFDKYRGFFPILINTIAGVRNVDGIYILAARNLGAGQATMFRRIILPAATPYILTGMRVGIGTAFICVIVAEMIAVNSGVGYRILEAREYMWSDKVIAGMFTIGFLGLVIDLCMDRLNRRLLRWHRGIATEIPI